MRIRLGVNIDHVATLRNARNELHPDPLHVAKRAINSGADSITIHLREDRRHIKDKDLKILSKNKSIPLNLEISSNNKILKIALKSNPNFICIVPEKRNEVTTEGGLDLIKNKLKLKKIMKKFNEKNIRTSLFINPTLLDVKISQEVRAKCVEFHMGKISNLVKRNKNFSKELKKIKSCCKYAKSLNLEVHAGHGIDYKTAKILKNIKEIEEFNIGHFIIGESLTLGISKTIKNFKKIIKK